MRLVKTLILLGCALGTTVSFAGPKEDFVSAVVAQCKKTPAEAEAMATPGRSGNVIKFKTCSAATVDIDGCVLQCKDASSSIGG